MSQDRDGGAEVDRPADMLGEGDRSENVYHRPVLVDVVTEVMGVITSGTVVDATFGGGGHASALRRELGHEVDIVGIDRDPEAHRQGSRAGFRVIAGDFGDLESLLAGAGVHDVTGVLFDFGVSSHQIDDPDRGFAYRHDGPLDMRMDPTQGTSAAALLQTVSEDELTEILRRYGEEPDARRIARAILAARPLETTGQLADVVAAASPRRRRGHPAKRVFQALRIVVNDELTSVGRGIDQALDLLSPGGRCVAISYHSLEDRIVKRRFAAGAAGCVCPPDLPVCACGKMPELELLFRKAVQPSAHEIAANPRARSARLRAVEKASAA